MAENINLVSQLSGIFSLTSALQADMGNVTISELVSGFARLPSIMVVGDAHQTSSTRAEPHQSSTQAAAAQLTPSHIQQQDASHLQFRGAPPEHTSQQGNSSYQHNQHLHPGNLQETGTVPPPSPRLEPTHRSTLSLNGSVASSPSRIKVRDLGHIQSFASEEVLSRSRHPSRHSLRGRLAGGQQYEISAMPVADIIEMVAGLLTKITTTVRPPSFVHVLY